MFLYLPAPHLQSPRSTAPLPPTGATEGTQELSQLRAQKNPCTPGKPLPQDTGHSGDSMSSIAGALPQGPPLCSAPRPWVQRPENPVFLSQPL